MVNKICIKLIIVIAITITNIQATMPQVPTTYHCIYNRFGLATVTHTRGDDNSQFLKYLDRYATMDCPIVTQINIVWNNEKSMQEMGIYQNKTQWKRPVYFYRTPNNSMNWRYKIAKQSKSQVFFSIDDDITVGCEELQKGFKVWRDNAIGNVGPIVSYGPRHFQYSLKSGFQYGRGKYKDFFNIGLVGLAFLSRHFMQLYYADLFQIKQMRDYVVTKNNCDDIGLNWMVQYFYPELKTIVIDGDILNISPKIAQTTSKNHYPFRTQCIKQFTQIFGVNSLRYLPANDTYPGKEKRISPLKQEIVRAKVEYLEKVAINQDTNYTGNPSALFDSAIKNTPISTPKIPKSNEPTKPASIPTSVSPSQPSARQIQLKQSSKRQIDKLNKQLQSLRKVIENYRQKQAQSPPQPKPQLGQSQLYKQRAKQAIQLSQQLRYSLYWHSYFQLILCIIIIFLLWRCLSSIRQSRSKRRVRLQSRQFEGQSIE